MLLPGSCPRVLPSPRHAAGTRVASRASGVGLGWGAVCGLSATQGSTLSKVLHSSPAFTLALMLCCHHPETLNTF